jgi:FkbH-like protein
VSAVGRKQALSPRFYFRATAPYQPRFWDELARRVLLASRGAGTYLYKVLVLDCDNTLWGGVIGEDLLDGIALSPDMYPGNVFWRVQHELLALQQRGVLLCLSTKNNPADVAEVLDRHPHQVIREEHLIVKKVGWGDKVDSLGAIAEELGLGLDSMVFLDDSPFEIEAVRERLPAVRCFQVPEKVFDYPALVGEISDLFLSGRPDDGGADKTDQYRLRATEQAERNRHGTREQYLASLGLTVELRRDPRDAIPRIAGLSQKSNQFNLTTRRYTEAQVADLVESPDTTVYTIRVGDRFGDSGITGIAIVRYEGTAARVESFLMSCRVLGRDIEQVPWATIAADARARGCTRLEAEWLRTARNAQVEDFYDRLGFEVTESTEDRRGYEANLTEIRFSQQPHITINHG